MFQHAHAQLLYNKTGYYIDFGSHNNTGTGYWVDYSNVSPNDSLFIKSESYDGLTFQGQDDYEPSPTGYVVVNHTYDYVGFLQNRFWVRPFLTPATSIDMSKPENMNMKIRLKSTGSLTPKNIYIKLMDTLGNITLNGASYFTISPTNEYKDYYFNFNNSWRDFRSSPMTVVDSSAISGFDFYVEFESPVTDIKPLKLEIDYIQLGSYVDWSFNTISGHIFNDNNANCILNSGDAPVKQGLVTALPGPYYAYTDENGFYELKVDTLHTSYSISYTPTNLELELLEKICPSTGVFTVSTPKGKSNYCCNDFSQKIKQCAILKIDINSNRRRRCFNSVTTVNYQNAGNVSSQPAQVKIVYPQYVKPISSVPAWTRKNGDTLYYSVGSIVAYATKTITIIDSVICGNESIRFLTQCTQASISPGNICINVSNDWDNADVVVKGACTNGVAKFTILNEGNGDMSDSTRYRVYANDTLISNHKFALKSMEYFKVELPTSGKVIRLEADQVANHPDYNTIPRVIFEGCVSSQAALKTAYKGIAMNVPQNNDLVTSTSCIQISDSYDPNDKAVSPKGVSSKNYISAGTRLTYKIRFENTGSDDAYSVVVVDTLDADLDATTFVAGSASHPYSIERIHVQGKEVVKFHFANINLTPKKIDSIKSQGFITFSISAKPTLSDGELIKNEASIFFDYNSAIITNMVSQTIGEYVEEDLTRDNIILRTAVSTVTTGIAATTTTNPVTIYPNPTNENIRINFSGSYGNVRINIYSVSGTLVLSKNIASENDTTLSLQQLNPGLYYYNISGSNGLNQNGKIVKQ